MNNQRKTWQWRKLPLHSALKEGSGFEVKVLVSLLPNVQKRISCMHKRDPHIEKWSAIHLCSAGIRICGAAMPVCREATPMKKCFSANLRKSSSGFFLLQREVVRQTVEKWRV